MIITEQSDLSLAPTLGPLIPSGPEPVLRAFDWASSAGFRSIQLDAALPGLKPRELSDRARKDLVAALSRRGLSVAGVDFFIPRKHYTEPGHVDRAVSAAVEAIRFAADVGRVPVHIGLPIKTLPGDVAGALLETADGHGVCLAVHAEDQLSELVGWLAGQDRKVAGLAIDPATLIALGHDPVKLVHQHAKLLAGARLCDVILQAEGNASGQGAGSVGAGIRCDVGRGELDVILYRLALDLAKGRPGPVVLDLRGLNNPLQSALAGLKAWAGASFHG
jgi:sugar phosphate isomerase/epimerase